MRRKGPGASFGLYVDVLTSWNEQERFGAPTRRSGFLLKRYLSVQGAGTVVCRDSLESDSIVKDLGGR